MLTNFGGMAVLSPLIFQCVNISLRAKRSRMIFWILGFLVFVTAYTLLNKLVMAIISDSSIQFSLLRDTKKLFLNFGHLLVLFYLTVSYLCWQILLPHNHKRKAADCLTLKIDGINKSIPYAKIEYLSTYDHYLKVYWNGQFQLLRVPLTQLLKTLPNHFVRIHRSHVISTLHINKVVRQRGSFHVYMSDDTVLPVSNSFKKNILPFLDKSQFTTK